MGSGQGGVVSAAIGVASFERTVVLVIWMVLSISLEDSTMELVYWVEGSRV